MIVLESHIFFIKFNFFSTKKSTNCLKLYTIFLFLIFKKPFYIFNSTYYSLLSSFLLFFLHSLVFRISSHSLFASFVAILRVPTILRPRTPIFPPFSQGAIFQTFAGEIRVARDNSLPFFGLNCRFVIFFSRRVSSGWQPFENWLTATETLHTNILRFYPFHPICIELGLSGRTDWSRKQALLYRGRDFHCRTPSKAAALSPLFGSCRGSAESCRILARR